MPEQTKQNRSQASTLGPDDHNKHLATKDRLTGNNEKTVATHENQKKRSKDSHQQDSKRDLVDE